MTAWPAAAVSAMVAVVAAFASAGLITWSGPVDAPDEGADARTVHGRPTPTSGGLAIMAGAVLGVVAFAALRRAALESWSAVATTLAFAGGLGLLGALDDVYDIGARNKLLIQAAAALAFAALSTPIRWLPLGGGVALPLAPWVGVLGAALWIVVVTNAVNFMDGANGVAPGSAALALAALSAAAFATGAPAVGGVALAGAAAGGGFLPWNLRGRLFQGDAGALFCGFLFAALALLVAGEGRGPVFLYFGPLAMLPFLTDVLLTLLARARRRQPLLQAHRDHLYQLWLLQTGRPHSALARRVWAIMALSCAAALAAQQAPSGWRPALFALAVLASAGGWVAARRRLEAL